MTLHIHNTLTRAKERFEPIDPNHVRMYVCGPTVYSFAHIGNARPVVVFDVLYRLLKRTYPKVTYVRNITDVDDKIIAASKATGDDIAAITERYTAAFHADMAGLGALPPDAEPRATGHIAQMIALIETLVANGNAYPADGHVLFNVPSMPDYGRLSGRNRDEMIAGARVEVAPYKKDPADFVLWKPSSDDQPGWDSPWGRGRPGWHLECSAMSEAHLGVPFDIHGGGLDLIFPHHENEIAQSRCAHGGGAFVRYWMHNGFLSVSGEKMSKSLGNIITVRELFEQGWKGETIRLALLSAHYRQPLDFSDAALEQADTALNRWYAALRNVPGNTPRAEPDERVGAALEDDLNTPAAIAAVHEIVTELNKSATDERRQALKARLLDSGRLLGVLGSSPGAWFDIHDDDRTTWVEDRLQQRAEARRAKDFATADSIRKELVDAGVLLEDKPDGTTLWRMR